MPDDTPTGSSAFQAAFGNMTDSQLRDTLSQISSAANKHEPQAGNSKVYMKNLLTWSTSTTPPPNTKSTTQSTRQRRANRSVAAAATPQPLPIYVAPVYMQPRLPALPVLPLNPPRAPIQPVPQALHSTYASRLRTGATLLMQPIIQAGSTTATRASRRGAVVNYADPGSGDDILDAGALDSDDSDFQASGGTRTALRQARASRMNTGINIFQAGSGKESTPQPPSVYAKAEKAELDQSYLGQVPPSKYIKPKLFVPTTHEYPTPDALEFQAQKPAILVPIRVEFETETHRIRDCFVWNLHETLIKPETFARIFCHDLDLPAHPWVDTVANQIKAQLEEHEGIASMDLTVDGYRPADVDVPVNEWEEVPECRVILSIDVQIATHHLLDHIEWDLLSPLTPEVFSQKLCAELGLSGEALPLISHAIHEELIKHKKDAIEWGVIGGDMQPTSYDFASAADRPRDRSGLTLVKDKTGLGLGWGRAPKDGRGPKPLKGVWRDWTEAEEFRTRFEVLSQEEVERREIEKERASRRLRRETSKFQSSTRTRRR